MISAESITGLILVIATGSMIVLFSTKKIRQRFPPFFRKIQTVQRLRRAIGLSVEDGSRIHVGLGNASLVDPSNPSALVGLSTLHRIGQLCSTSDQPPVSSSGDGGFSILSKDVLRSVAVETNTRELFDPDQGYLTGVTPFSYAVGAMDLMSDPTIKTSILVGNFGPEAGFLTAMTESNRRFALTASDSITAQSVFYATSEDVLIGEELFAIPAYLAYSPVHAASLRTQDILRFLVGIALVGGALLKVFGLI